MKSILKAVLPAAGVLAAAAGAFAYMTAPGRAEEEKKRPFMGRNFAHRGLHTSDRRVPENSLAAFSDAAENGYGIELDVRLSSDGRVIVFHDDALERMCSHDGAAEDYTFEELSHLRLAGSNERIPLLSEVLELVGGRVPVIIEIKRGRDNKELCSRTLELLRCYGGEVCVESFDPTIVRWWRKNAPQILRGQLSCAAEDFGDGVSPFRRWALSHLLLNFVGRPQFVAYGISAKKPLGYRLCSALGAMKVCWTSRSWLNEEGSDAVIFEFYRPRPRFRNGGGR